MTSETSHAPPAGASPVSATRRAALVVAPFAIIATMQPIFQWCGAVFGPVGGVLVGFICYWVGWCWLFPRWVMKPRGLRDLFRPPRPRFGRPAWLGMVLLLIPPLIGVANIPPQALARATLPNILIAAALGLINGTAEETLWRGIYPRAFAGKFVLGYLYPSIGFAVWHFVPPADSPGPPVGTVISAAVLGPMWAWVVWQTGSIRWVAGSHAVLNFTQHIGR